MTCLENATIPTKSLPLSGELLTRLCCPACHARLDTAEGESRLTCRGCGSTFPIVDGVPILIHEPASLFSIGQVVQKSLDFERRGNRKLSEIAKSLLPSSSANYPSRHNYAKLREELRKKNASPKVLVLGGGVAGSGFEALLSETEIDLLETDVFMTRRTRLVCDAHDIPFENQTFDAVVIQAVLEHVVDPWRCVEEIQRVLKDGGFVYAEVSFMQQVHAGAYDFTRFTHLGLRRLFRSFAEISSGVSCGPGTAAAWSVQHLALSFFEGRWSRWLAIVVARLASFWLRYLDRFLLDKPGALDAASALYFLGSKGSVCLADHDLIRLYRGAQ
jgi:uncharacterized protein YbaR (Trm112 family)